LYSSELFLIVFCISVVIHSMHAMLLRFALLTLHPISFPKTDITQVLSARKASGEVFDPFYLLIVIQYQHIIYTSAKIFFYLVNFRH